MQRKIFRVERMFVDKRERADARAFHTRVPIGNPTAGNTPQNPAGTHSPDPAMLAELRRELETIHRAIDRNKHEPASLHAHSETGHRVTRAAHALGAAIGGMEKATQQILRAAESIDEGGRALQVAIKTDYERNLAQDIQEQVVRIYEACNFQDLSGQHITKAMDTLNFIERHVARMIDVLDGIERSEHKDAARPPLGRSLVNGPKLDGDSGHVSQDDIDAMFD